MALPFIRCQPWCLQQMLLLVDLARQLHKVLKSHFGDGRLVLSKLLRILSRLGSMSIELARQVLRMPWEGAVPHQDTL
jgi:hypothetical protein